MKRYNTTRKALGFEAKVCTREGTLTGFKLLIPYNSPQRIALGSLEFDIRQSPQGKHFAYALGQIPDSWLIDLNSSPVEHEELAA